MGQTKNNGAAQTPAASRNYKSAVFAMLFGGRERLLSLYNAISEKNYQNPETLEINTLENAIYIGMKNDTVNPNMPLRFLFYISDLYSGMTVEENLYGRKALSIPTPCFVVQQESQPGANGSLPGSKGLCGIRGQSEKIYQRAAHVRGGGTCHYRVHPGRNLDMY